MLRVHLGIHLGILGVLWDTLANIAFESFSGRLDKVGVLYRIRILSIYLSSSIKQIIFIGVPLLCAAYFFWYFVVCWENVESTLEYIGSTLGYVESAMANCI